jgi:hypothetical protein
MVTVSQQHAYKLHAMGACKRSSEKLSSKSKRWIRDICPSTPAQDFFLAYVVVEVCSIAPEHSQYCATSVPPWQYMCLYLSQWWMAPPSAPGDKSAS